MPVRKIVWNKAFILIDLLIIITIFGILALGIIFTIDPIEQVRKTNDNSSLNTATEIYSAISRLSAIRGRMPLITDIFESTLNSPEAYFIIKELEQAGELKINYLNSHFHELNNIYLSASVDGEILSLCFRPLSKSFQLMEKTTYNRLGSKISCEISSCYLCIGQVDENKIAQYHEQMTLTLCKLLNAECEINNSEKACCSDLVCVPYGGVPRILRTNSEKNEAVF